MFCNQFKLPLYPVGMAVPQVRMFGACQDTVPFVTMFYIRSTVFRIFIEKLSMSHHLLYINCDASNSHAINTTDY